MNVINNLKPILCKAAVAYAPKTPLTIEEVYVAPPQKGEVRVKVISNALCHTDIYTLDGLDPEGLFPCILGHEATAMVESVGEGVESVKVGDIVIPCYTPQCREPECVFCSSQKTNLCPKIRSTQGKGVMPDGTSRFTNKKGETIYHFMGCSTFSEYTVIAEISAAKINKNADLNKVCVLGCGISTGWGAAINNSEVKPGSTAAVWGLGAVGLAVIQAAKLQGASKIYAIDNNPSKFEAAKALGANVCLNPEDGNIKDKLLETEKWGIDHTFDCTGNVQVMRTALESAHRGFGESCVIGVAASGKEISTRPFQLVTGRKWVGTAFGGWKSRDDVPKLVNKTLTGELPIDQFITHNFDSIEEVNKSIDALHGGNCLRAVVKINTAPETEPLKIKVAKNIKLASGTLKTVQHWSAVNNCEMTFNLYLPEDRVNHQRCDPYPVLYFLAGLECTHQNAPSKSSFAAFAQKYKIAVVFPDTSPRNTGLSGIDKDYSWGESAGYYCNATADKYKKHFNMFSYINEELPQILGDYFHVSYTKRSITGFSMGGHGALISALKTGNFKSVSAFAPICNPTKSEWGTKAYEQFFSSPEEGNEYDSVEILKSGKFSKIPVMVDVGSSDPHWNKLGIDAMKSGCHKGDLKVDWRIREGYNHSFYYVSSFVEQHFDFHHKYLNA